MVSCDVRAREKKRTRQFGGKGLIFMTQGGERAEDLFQVFIQIFISASNMVRVPKIKQNQSLFALLIGDFWTPPQK
jgi:hypothetical protein